ncbi:MAG: gliding motility-associated C-terminal domain-containing protein [Crocinitomicaceae bacterium]|nr:gliding motility-associated C-terminal domain-containing protein [Crocinitomicaceae bacterium]
MKNLTQIISFLSLVLLTAGNANAQCGATSVEALPDTILICEGDPGVANFNAFGTCSGNWEFQVTQGAGVVQVWGTTASFTASPTSTTLYTVFARCSACPATVVQANFTIEVLEEPTVNAPTLVCSGSTATLTASGSTGTYEWYDASTGGNLVGIGGSFTTPPLTQDSTYWVSVQGTVSGVGGSILITECGVEGAVGGTGSEDYIEISNLYTTPVNTTGWRVVVSSSYNNINLFNATMWNLPNSFAPCSMMSRTDNNQSNNYWGNNIFWNPNNNSWAMILDDNNNIIDFVCWGWTAAQLAGFGPNIGGTIITLGNEWLGNGIPPNCGTVGGVQHSMARTGSADNNNAGDFICQPTSVDLVNPGLNCGWTASAQCRFPTTIAVDVAPTASNPATINVQCAGDVPLPDVTVVTDEADDFTAAPIVTHEGDVSDGLSCPETITRTYRVTDVCGNFIDVQQLIVIMDTQGPIMDPPPAAASVQCVGDIPAPAMLGYTDNCDAPGTVLSVDGPLVGGTCGGTVTRTWTSTDVCGNISAAVTQTFTVLDNIAPTAGTPAPINVECFANIPVPDGSVVPGPADNCSALLTVNFLGDVSDGQSCPETITRSYEVVDDCGNTVTVYQTITVNDITPPTASNPATASYPLLSDVPLGNASTGVVTDEADNCTVSPTVTWVSDVSDNDICAGETITRTFSVTDDCGNEIFVTQAITIDPLPVPIDAGPDQTVCVGEMVTLTPVNPTGAILTWNPASASGPFVPAGTATYTVTADFNGCTNTDQVTVFVEEPPVVSFFADVLAGCEPLQVTFTNTSTAASGLVNCDWTMNGESINGCGSVTYTFPQGGTYDVTLTTTSATGCVNSETYADYIYVEETPVAGFGVSTDQLSTLETYVEFYNTSVGAVDYIWDFDDNSGLVYVEDPTHEFPTSDGGSYNVQLIASSPLGCLDTTWVTVAVDVELLYFIPNTFTPDNDAFNQYFKPIFTAGFDPFDFNMLIFNRWGEVIWESNDATVGWDGTYNGKLVADGTYAWKIEFKTAYSDERKMINGHVNIMK